MGLSLRKRECSSPYSGPRGSPCIGEYTDVKICMLQQCQDAGAYLYRTLFFIKHETKSKSKVGIMFKG